MAKIDKIIAAGRTYSILFLSLGIGATAVAATETSHWISLSRARQAAGHWILYDFIDEDFEDWWANQKVTGGKVTSQYRMSPDLQAGRERYYTSFGAARVAKQAAAWKVVVGQPTRSHPETPATANIPDVRAEIPDLLGWDTAVESSELPSRVFSPLSDVEAAGELGAIALNDEFKKNNPAKAAALPALLKDDWSADGRWLTLQSEKEKAASQLAEIVSCWGKMDGVIPPRLVS
jgi:hypothetical protein